MLQAAKTLRMGAMVVVQDALELVAYQEVQGGAPPTYPYRNNPVHARLMSNASFM